MKIKNYLLCFVSTVFILSVILFIFSVNLAKKAEAASTE